MSTVLSLNKISKHKKDWWLSNTCDQCKHKTWKTDVKWNYTIQDHQPITMRCPYYKNGSCGIVRGSIACHHFELEK